jgi:hypothetical protein
MSVSIEAAARDLIQDGIEVVLVEVDVVTAAVVVVLVVVAATVVEGSAALTAEKSANVRLSAACATDAIVPTAVPGAFDPKKEGPIEPVSSTQSSVLVEWPVCNLNDIILSK